MATTTRFRLKCRQDSSSYSKGKLLTSKAVSLGVIDGADVVLLADLGLAKGARAGALASHGAVLSHKCLQQLQCDREIARQFELRQHARDEAMFCWQPAVR